ncbi:hypothetical protein QPK87_01265 [Kamptonema cortianum]|nr:hypothetical protein [Geitlerinema splendidum]MDK3155217.1 hypothetical protein [Kamptonema cortianum]
MNFIRFVAGLEPVTTCDPELSERAQWGSLIMGVNKSIGHSLPKPTSLDASAYLLGSMGLAQGNLALFRGKRASIREVLDEQMFAAGANSIHAGHRRWLLNPAMEKVGVGLIQPECEIATYAVVIANDASKRHFTTPMFIAWPSPGPFPFELYRQEMPWTISLNPKEFKISATTRLQVKITDAASGRIWSAHHSEKAARAETTFSYHVNRQGFGWQDCLILLPPKNFVARPNEEFVVSISGLKKPNGSEENLQYSTKFVRVSGTL